MLDNNIEEMLKDLTDGEIATLIGLAYREKQDRDEAKKTKCMNAINKDTVPKRTEDTSRCRSGPLHALCSIPPHNGMQDNSRFHALKDRATAHSSSCCCRQGRR